MARSSFDNEAFQERVAELATILCTLAEGERLAVACRLVEWGEGSLSALSDAVQVCPLALSDHLAEMAAQGIVATRHDGDVLWYRIDDPRIEQLFATMHGLLCRDSHGERQL